MRLSLIFPSRSGAGELLIYSIRTGATEQQNGINMQTQKVLFSFLSSFNFF